MKTFPTYNTGNNLYLPLRRDATEGLHRRDPAGRDPEPVELAPCSRQVDSMASEVPLDAPWTAPKARGVGRRRRCETWKLANTTPTRRATCSTSRSRRCSRASRATCRCSTSSSTSTPAGSFDNLINTAGGAQEIRFVGGSQTVSLRVARRPRPRVVLGAPVRRIVRARAGVGCSATGTWRREAGDRRVPPALAGADPLRPGAAGAARPAHPAHADGLGDQVPSPSTSARSGATTVATGQATSDTGPVSVTFDNSPPAGSPGVLLGFIEGQQARIWGARSTKPPRCGDRRLRPATSDRRREAEPLRRESWADERWSGGCYVGYMPPGVLLDYGDGAAPAGRPRSTGPAPRPRPSGRATWMARSSRATGRPTRCSKRSDLCRGGQRVSLRESRGPSKSTG